MYLVSRICGSKIHYILSVKDIYKPLYIPYILTQIKLRCYRTNIYKNILEVLKICSVLPKVRLTLCEPEPIIEDYHRNSILSIIIVSLQRIILEKRETRIENVKAIKAALSLIIKCVCTSVYKVCNLVFIVIKQIILI